MTKSFTILENLPTDLEDNCHIHQQAFGQTAEADLVRALYTETNPDFHGNACLSLSAKKDTGEFGGHILFSPAKLQTIDGLLPAVILAPLAVLPIYQHQGLGKALIKAGLTILTEKNVELVFVLGDPAYYSKSGFIATEGTGYLPPYPLSPAYQAGWQYQNLSDKQIAPGQLICAPALQRPELWQE